MEKKDRPELLIEAKFGHPREQLTDQQINDDLTESIDRLPEINEVLTKKFKVRQTFQDKGVFKTGVDVVEHEVEIDTDLEGKINALRMYRDGKLTSAQIKEILVKKLNQEKIFGYGSFDEFYGDYFKKQLVVVEDMNRVQQLKDARQRYQNRFKAPQQKGYGSFMQD